MNNSGEVDNEDEAHSHHHPAPDVHATAGSGAETVDPAALGLEAALKAAGYRVTIPRQLVWATLSDAASHITVDALAALVHQRDKSVNRASVYRSLTLFEELGLARQSRLGHDSASTWEISHPDEHFHLVCRICGSVDHHRGSLVRSVRDHLSGDHGFVVDQIELTVTGTCNRCSGIANESQM